MNQARKKLAWWLARMGVLALATWVRVDNYKVALSHGELLPQGDGDSAYHLSRILGAIRHFPHVSEFDPLVNWPRGAYCLWAEGFDVVGALFVKLLGGGGSEATALIAASLWPAFLGVLVVWATMKLAWRVAPARGARFTAIGAGILVALIPEFVVHSRFGRVDHHVFEALIMVLLADWSLGACRPDAAARPRRERLAFELEGAALAALGIWFFTGSTLYVALAVAVVLFSVLAARGPQPLLGSGAAGMVAGALTGAGLTWPALAQHRRVISFMFPSLLQPALVALAGAGLALAVAATRLRPRASWRGRLALLAGGTLLLVGAVALAAPRFMAELVAGSSGWLLHRDPWIASIVEFQPIFGKLAAAGGNWNTIHIFFGWPGFFFPVALPLATWWVWRSHRWRALAFFFVASSFTGLTLLQSRFSRVGVPFLAIAVAVSFQAILGVLAARRRALRPWRGAVAVGALSMLALADPPLREELYVARPEILDPYQSAALALHLDHPPVAGHRDGVAIPWTWGHWVEYQGHRPVVVDGFGSYLDQASFWEMDSAFAGDERGLVQAMDRHDLGYVVNGPLMLNVGKDGELPFANGIINDRYMVATPLAPLALAGSGIPASGVRHLEHLMPWFATHQIVSGLRFQLPAMWVYQRVAGARLRGTAPPRSRVVAELKFREQRRPHTWKAWADAGPDGRWEMTVPVPTRYWGATIQTAPAWLIHVGEGAPVRVEVPEKLVREGGAVEVGSLPVTPATTPLVAAKTPAERIR